MDHRMDTAVQAPGLGGRGWLVMAAAAAVLVGPACLLNGRPQSGGVSAGAPAPSVATAAMRPPPPDVEAAAESQRKVQIALGDGSPQDALLAAHTLQTCAHAARISEALYAAPKLRALMPPELKKVVDSFGGIKARSLGAA